MDVLIYEAKNERPLEFTKFYGLRRVRLPYVYSKPIKITRIEKHKTLISKNQGLGIVFLI